MSLRSLLVFSLTLFLLNACTGTDPTTGRGPLGKSDQAGTCQSANGSDFCDGPSDGACWCDSACVGFGDCCSDVVAVCEEVKLTHLGMNDVSILWPLPTPDSIDDLPSLVVAADGILLPEQFEQLPSLIFTEHPVAGPLEQPSNEELLPQLKIVAMRIDPCFRDDPTVGECQHQLRIVLQPVRLSLASNKTEGRDATIHLFFALNSDELIDALLRVDSGTESDSQHPLGVNPTLMAQGNTGEYATRLKGLIQDFARPESLIRITFMLLRAQGNRWEFGGFHVVASQLSPIIVANTSGSEVVSLSLNNQLMNRSLNGSITPALGSADDATGVVNSEPTVGDVADSLAQLYRIENPEKHGPGTVDCASCHIAMAAREITMNDFPDILVPSDNKYESPWNLEVTGATITDGTSLRAFGYFTSKAAISQRTVNETAEVLQVLSAQGL